MLVCGDCGQAHRWARLDPGRIAHCSRCDAVLARGHRLGVASLLALTLAALVVLLIANTAALVSIRLGGNVVDTNLPTAIMATWRDGAPLVAALVTFTAVIAPALFIGLRLWLLLPLALGRMPPALGPCLRVLHTMAHWNTVSVLAVGALLSLVRMAALAQVTAGPALVAIGTLAILLAAIESAGLRHLWPADAGVPP
jgi:paraquat-inducible protein A